MRAISIAKFEKDITNEDAAIAKDKVIAVSDGAGGGGVFAEIWSKYLVEHLPLEPIKDYESFDKWVDDIWESFYNDCEEKAKAIGGMFLNKFYDEGSFATLVAVWKDGDWIAYGDSVAFCYNVRTGILQHSYTELVDFNNPPYLVNWKNPLNPEGFRSGRFEVDGDCVVFAASDTLAHYILMMYEIANNNGFDKELREAVDAQTKNSNFVKTAMSLGNVDFREDVIRKLQNCKNWFLLERHIKNLKNKGLIGHDDYSIVI